VRARCQTATQLQCLRLVDRVQSIRPGGRCQHIDGSQEERPVGEIPSRRRVVRPSRDCGGRHPVRYGTTGQRSRGGSREDNEERTTGIRWWPPLLIATQAS